jgi:hypothetical protein
MIGNVIHVADGVAEIVSRPPVDPRPFAGPGVPEGFNLVDGCSLERSNFAVWRDGFGRIMLVPREGDYFSMSFIDAECCREGRYKTPGMYIEAGIHNQMGAGR